MATLSLSRLPWYGQLLVFVAMSGAAAGAFWHFHAAPAQVAIDEQRARLAATQGEVSRAQRTASNLPAFRQEVGALEAQLDRLRAVLPEEQDVADLLRRVQGMATQSRLAIKRFLQAPDAVGNVADNARPSVIGPAVATARSTPSWRSPRPWPVCPQST